MGGNIRLKPKNSPTIDKWKAKGGTVEVLDDGTHRYTDWEGNTVDYKNGHPDFTPYERQSVEIQQKGNHTTDYSNAEKASSLDPPKLPKNTWHHHENGTTMQEVPFDIHKRFNPSGWSFKQ
jgi:DNase/tRNase domain of colicin-like bacteriocin